MKTAMRVLWAAAVMAWAGSAPGEVIATARSPEGAFTEFRVVLDAEGAPRAVANFMGLVDGSRAWVDPETGEVRGGGEADSFYDGTVFHGVTDGIQLRGGLRGVEGSNGGVEYTGGPGYTIVGKTNEARTAFGGGALALVEGYGPHSGGSEIVFLLTNSMVTWTVFGNVAAGDEDGLASLVARVESEGATEVRWEVDTASATEAELAALETGRGELPEAAWVEARQTVAGMIWPLPGTGWLKTSTCTNLTEGEWSVGEYWDENGARNAGWGAFGLGGGTGFALERFAGVRYPLLAKSELAGQWKMSCEHTGVQIDYWFDFSGKTGRWEQVESGVVTDRGTFTGLSVQRLTGNSFGVAFTLGSGFGTIWSWYYLGFAGESERTGRFMSEQLDVVGNYSSDWGLFTLAEGWEEAEGSEKAKWASGSRRRAIGQGGSFGVGTADGGGGRRDLVPEVLGRGGTFWTRKGKSVGGR